MPLSRGRLRVAAAAVGVVVVAVVLVLVLKGGDEPEQSEKAAAKPLPALEQAWTAKLDSGSAPLKIDTLDSTPHGQLSLWAVDDELVMLGRNRVTAYNASTGQRQWSMKPPGKVCGASEAPNAQGLGGLIFKTEGGCKLAALIDTATGKLRWRTELTKHHVHTANDEDVAVGERTVGVTLGYEGFELLDVRTGKPVQAKPAPSRAEAIVGQGRLVLIHRGRIRTVEIYDLDSRRKVSDLQGDDVDVEGIVSGDPLILDLRSADGHRDYRHVDENGKQGAFVGKSIDNEPQLAGVLGDTVVVSYDITNPLDRTARYYGFDLTTGEQRWTTDPQQTFVLGRRDDSDLLTLSLGGVGVAGAVNEGITGTDRTLFVLGQAPAADPSEQALLGTLAPKGSWDLDYSVGWTDSLFLTQREDGTLTAYELPQPGSTPLPVPKPKIAWAKEDIRSEATVDACEKVRPETLKALKIKGTQYPPPSDCSWLELFNPDGFDRALTVSVFALPPNQKTPAAEVAKQNMGKLRHDETNRFKADTPYPGLGEEAWTDQNERRNEELSRLLVRERNVIVLVDSRYGGYAPRPHPRGRALLRLQAQAAEDVLSGIR